jgi:DNA-binding CsgD family transcriptional regulator
VLDRVWALATGERSRALLAAAHGDLAAATNHANRSLEHHERLGQPFELGRTLLVAGSIARRAKRQAEARRLLGQATEIFDGLGARVFAARARTELARVQGRARSGPNLTETERQVADLVAAGLTNREVADRLFVSVRTVEANLSRTYAKLGVRSRTELAGRLTRR